MNVLAEFPLFCSAKSDFRPIKFKNSKNFDMILLLLLLFNYTNVLSFLLLIWTKCILIQFSFCSFQFDCNRAFITSYILCLLLYFVTFALHHYVYRSLSIYLSLSLSLSRYLSDRSLTLILILPPSLFYSFALYFI